MNIDIEEAIENFRSRSAVYAKNERYYSGNHDLAFATDKFKNAFGSLFREFALNLCPAVCDTVRDKLRVTRFSVESPEKQAEDVRSQLMRIWGANRMRIRAGEIHKEALKCGDAYMFVWPDANGKAMLYPNRAANCTVTYDDEIPGRVVRAAKHWRGADKRVRINLFYPYRIEKYISKAAVEGTIPPATEFVPLSELPAVAGGKNMRTSRGAAESETHRSNIQSTTPAYAGGAAGVVENPYGMVPVFHFYNNADIGAFGRSELEAAIPIQDGLNKSMLDMLVAMEFAAYRQRWAAGIEVQFDEAGHVIAPYTAGVDALWISQNPDAKFGDFATANLEQFLKVKDSFRGDIASVTGTPLHYFMQNSTRALASGEALKKAESRFLAKIRDRQESFGQVWADVMQFALTVEGTATTSQLITQWEDPAPMSDKEFLENILLKKQIGLSVDQALIEVGYGKADVKGMVGFEQ